MKLKRKVLSSVLLVTLVPGIIGIVLSLWVAKDILYRNIGRVLQSAAECYVKDVTAHLFSPETNSAGGVEGEALGRYFIRNFLDHHEKDPSYHIDLVQDSGTVLFDSLGDRDEIFPTTDMEKMRMADSGWFTGTRHGTPFVSGFKRLSPSTSHNSRNPAGNLYLVVSDHQSSLDHELAVFFSKVALPSMLVILLIAAGWYHITRRQLLNPLESLYEGVDAVKKGKMDCQVHIRTGDEIQSLAEEFNVMVQNLKVSQDRLQEVLVRDKKKASIGTLAAGIAHELNNPLTAVIGFTESIQRRAAGDNFDREAVLRSVQKIQDSGWRCVKIIEALKSYAREATSDREEEDINDLIKAGILLVAHQFQSWASIEIIQSLMEKLPPVYCDRTRIQQVIINLLINARDAMPDGGTITVRTRQEQEHIVIAVEDTGTGIPPEVLDRIFDPFFTTKGVGEGTGLGLSICNGIIASHGGTIIASNKPDGTGAVFTVRLPLSHEQSKRSYAETDKFGNGIGTPLSGETPPS